MSDPGAAQAQGAVLIVDDDRNSLHLLAQIVTMSGYTVRTANSGLAALESVADEPPDLVLLDVMMPGLSGLEVCSRLKEDELTRDIPVLFLTALGTFDDKLAAFRMGAVDYITKPFNVDEVLARVSTHATLARLRRQLQELNRELLARNEELEKRNSELQLALDTIQRLSGLLPICGWCGRKVELEEGSWVPLERYIEDHSTIVFTHGMCPECLEKANQEASEAAYVRRLVRGNL